MRNDIQPALQTIKSYFENQNFIFLPIRDPMLGKYHNVNNSLKILIFIWKISMIVPKTIISLELFSLLKNLEKSMSYLD